MWFFTSLTSLQTIIIFLVVLFFSGMKSWEISSNIKRKCKNQKLRGLPYFKRNFFAKILLLGLEGNIEIEIFVLNIIEKIMILIIFLICIANLVFNIDILSTIIKISIIVEFIVLFILHSLMGTGRTYDRKS